MIFSTGMEGGSFVMCEDLCGTPELSFDGAGGVLAGAAVPGGGGGNGPFCCAPRVSANKPLAIKSSGRTPMAPLAAPTASKVSPSISSSLLTFLFIVIYSRIRCMDLHFRGLNNTGKRSVTENLAEMGSPLLLRFLITELATDEGHKHLNALQLLARHGQYVSIHNDEISEFAGLE